MPEENSWKLKTGSTKFKKNAQKNPGRLNVQKNHETASAKKEISEQNQTIS